MAIEPVDKARQEIDLPTLCRAVADASPMPMAGLGGHAHTLRYVNLAFCLDAIGEGGRVTIRASTKGLTGNGLGLWVGKQIIEKHGGSIRVRSRTCEPQGTTFSIVLPVLAP